MEVYDNVSWMTVDDHGATTGNGYVTHTCEGGYKGRVQREGHTTITTTAETPATAVVNFVQLPVSEYVRFDEDSYQVSNEAGTLTVTGKTNSPRLAFALTANQGSMATIPASFSIKPEGNLSWIDGQDVEGETFTTDYGASGEIAFKLTVAIAANGSVDQRYCTLKAEGSNGVLDTVNIIQAASASYINLTSEHKASHEIVFDAAGQSGGSSSVNVDVYSNDTWEVTTEED